MKKQIIIGTALVAGLFSFGAFASAAEACENCVDKQVLKKFTDETATLSTALKAKNLQLREVYAMESVDVHRVNQLEGEIKELRGKIDASADKLGIAPCSRG